LFLTFDKAFYYFLFLQIFL